MLTYSGIISNLKSIHQIFYLGYFLFLFSFFFKINLFLFLAALGLCCCVRAFSSCGEWRLLFVVVRRLLIAVASLVTEQGSRRECFSSCGTRAQQSWLVGSRAQAQQLWHMGLVALWHVGSSWTRVRTRVPCIGRRILNHCATRKFPILFFKSRISIQFNLYTFDFSPDSFYLFITRYFPLCS